jgi:hypothetical protein
VIGDLAGVFAHQGGWDEALLIAVPMAAVAWLLWLARRRVRRAEEAAAIVEPQEASDRRADTM